MKRFGRVVAGLAGWMLAVCGGILFLGTAAALRRGSPHFGPDVFASAFFLAVAAAGVLVIRLAWPGQLARLAHRAAAAVTSLAAFSNPLVHGAAIYLVAVPLLAVTGEAAILVAAFCALVYAVVSPVLVSRGRRVWLNAPVSVVVGIVLIAALPATTDALAHRRFGDDWMVMLGPVMLYPVVLVAALALRLVRPPRRTPEGV